MTTARFADYIKQDSETHGMAQRGGSVESHVRINEVYSPLIPPGQADLILSFELLEALRYRHYLKERGTMLLNDLLIVPTSVFLQKLSPPMKDDIVQRLSDTTSHLIDATSLALKAGSPLTQNLVMVGAASAYIPLSPASIIDGMKRWVPQKTIAMNMTAFDLGRAAVKGKPNP
jgi:indolepyruvate ferredoxin oxidoreductase beta subunit